MWCVADLDDDYIDKMEDVLELYEKAYNPQEPVVCVDEKPVTLHADVRPASPAAPGREARRDNEYERRGTANVFCAVEPRAGRHFTFATPDRSGFEFAQVAFRLAIAYPEARTIHLVMDNLNIHRRKPLIDLYGAEVGDQIWNCFTPHYTPTHGSWLNQAEIEIGILARQCLGHRRISDLKLLRQEVRAWNRRMNREHIRINCTFDRKTARRKFGYKRNSSTRSETWFQDASHIWLVIPALWRATRTATSSPGRIAERSWPCAGHPDANCLNRVKSFQVPSVLSWGAFRGDIMQKHRNRFAHATVLATVLIAAAASAFLAPPLAWPQAPSQGMDPQLLARANAGDANSQYLVAFAYQNGVGIPKDLAEAAKWYRKAAEGGNPRSMANLGVMYENGHGGLPRDDVQAVNWLRKASEAGDAYGMGMLGTMYEAGRGGLAKDDAQAVSCYRKAAEAGDASGMIRFGVGYTTGLGGLARDDVQAVIWLRKAAEAGDAHGMGMLGTMYEAGRGGLAKDEAQAASWYRKAAEAGDAIGMAFLGDMYVAGRGGLARDDAQAASWFRKAAEAGNGHGMANLGNMYALGRGGLPKDDVHALSWYRKAAGAGDASGMRQLGILYLTGRGGLTQDKVQAVSWLNKAAQLHDANAQRVLAQLEQANVRCMERDGLGNQLTPVELYKDVASCIDQAKYDDGLFLFALAGAYGRFDILRVKDATAHEVAYMLPVMFFNQLDQTKVAAFKERVKQMSGNDALKAKYCLDLESMSPPDYFPTYMISHGMASYANAMGVTLPGSNAGENPLVSPFDAPKVWKQAVDEYLQCKKPEGTGRSSQAAPNQ